MYAINGWIGYCNNQQQEQLAKIVRRGIRSGWWSKADGDFASILSKRSNDLFQAIISNSALVLWHLLPEKKDMKYELQHENQLFVLSFMVSPHDT